MSMALVEDTIVKPRERVRSAERSPPPNRGAVVFIALVEDTAVIPREKAPVVLLKKIGAVAESDVVVIFASKVANDEDERNPDVPRVAVAILIVQVPDEDAIVIPDELDVAKVSAFQIVTAPVAPETAIPVPAVVEETKLEPSEFCLPLKVVQSAAERNPA